MPLILKILSFNGQPYTEGEDVIIDEQGGTIGRSDTNTLILADEKKTISRRHATVEFENGQYKLIDSSLAGTFIDNAIEPINNASVQLVDGMQIRIGDYAIVCSITDEVSPFLSAAPVNPFADGSINVEAEDNALLDNVESDFNSPFLAGEQDFSEDLLASVEKNTASDLLNTSDNNLLLDQVTPDFNGSSPLGDNSLLDSVVEMDSQADQGLMAENVSSLNDSFVPAEPVKNNSILDNGEMPEDFNFEDLFKLEDKASEYPSSDQQLVVDESVVEVIKPAELKQDTYAHPAPVQAPSAPVKDIVASNQAPVIEKNQLLQAFLRGAQIDPKNIDFNDPDEKMTRIGKMFRQFVESTVSVLRSRAEFKSLFRVSVTTIKRSDNNPLKFAVTTDEALKHLINDGQGGFKKSVESIDEGFNDLLNHQLAMQAGIQASLTDILRQFDPVTIEKQYEEGIVLQKKSKCWEKYIQVHTRLSETAVDDFFGDAFSEAYEKQMKQLKN